MIRGDSRQGNLFGDPPAPERGKIGIAAVPEELTRIATRLPAGIRLGTSSWSFPGWDGLVYDRHAPPGRLAREGLAAYARHPLLRTVGIDRTYYAPIPAVAFAGYAAATPPEFRFLVKAASDCTTPARRDPRGGSLRRNERFLDAAFAAAEVVGPVVEGLGERAGPLVFQFPPLGAALTREPERFAETLAAFLAGLPPGPLYAVEPRDRELLVPSYFAALRESGARHCHAIHPRMPPLADQLELTREEPEGPLVVRWMLHAGLGYEEARARYAPFSRLVDEDPSTREVLARAALEHARRGCRVFVIANNKAEGSAPLSVFRLAERIAAG